jgi:hypothetical protein
MTAGTPAGQGYLLSEVLPTLVEELRELLAQEGQDELSEQLADLRIVDWCRCGDEFCSMMYAVPRRQDPWGPGHRHLALNPSRGIIVLDVVDGRIVAIEVLYRPEVRERLLALLP